MKKILFLFLLLIFLSSCKTSDSIYDSKTTLYNIYGKEINYVKVTNGEMDLNKGIYFLRTIDDDAPYWTKVVKIL